jgi:hypothetical protein
MELWKMHALAMISTVVETLYWGDNPFAVDNDDWRKYKRVLQLSSSSQT